MKLKRNLLVVCAIISTSLFIACSNDIDTDNLSLKKSNPYQDAEVLAIFDETKINDMVQVLKKEGIELSEVDDEAMLLRCSSCSSPEVVALKIQASTNAAGGGRVVESGVLLVPSKSWYYSSVNTFNITIAAPDNMFSNEDVPSLIFKNGINQYLPGGSVNQYYFWVQKVMRGSIVFIPDYLGFGSSKGSSLPAYGNRNLVQSSMIDLIKVVRNTLSVNNYKYQQDITVSGYGYGGYVATAIASALEVDNALPGVGVNKLVIADAPVNLTKTAELILLGYPGTASYLLPAILSGNYNAGDLSQSMLNNALKSPYNTEIHPIFDDNNGILTIEYSFPSSVTDLYMTEFIQDFGSTSTFVNTNIRAITTSLTNSSIQAWARTKPTYIIISKQTSNGFYPIVTQEFATSLKNKCKSSLVTTKVVTDSKASFKSYMSSQ